MPDRSRYIRAVIKVSVVVPTYRSGDGLDRLISSLDAQTLPASEFEVIFVDDGSPDDTFERLQRIASTRPNVRLERIENSGWPCRPRNVGTDLARGEYVAYMDHDDLLYPDALRGAYDYAVANGADVVNGKEARTRDATWAIDTYRADEPQSVGRRDQNALIPMNPHKLYRRAFLDEHGIRFREGGRVLWEDIFFNLLVQKHAKVVSTLASVPYYHWYTTPGSGSHGFLRSSDPFWMWMREVLQAIDADLAGEAHALERGQLRAHQYRGRILGSFDTRFRGRPEAERDMIYSSCRGLQEDFALWEHDGELGRSAAIRARLLREDRRALLEELPSHDPVLPGRVQVDSARWVDGRLELAGAARWASADGRTHALRTDGGAIMKDLPAVYRDVLPSELLDVTSEVREAVAEFGIRSVDSRVTWMLPSTSEVSVREKGGSVSFSASVTGVFDPDTAVFGRPVERGAWEVNARSALGQSTQQDPVKGAIRSAAVLYGDEIRLVMTDAEGALTVVVGDTAGLALQVSSPDAGGVTVDEGADGLRVSIPLPGIEAQRAGTAATSVMVAVDGQASDFAPVAATITARDGVAVLDLRLPRHTKHARLRLGDRVPSGPAYWQLDLHGGSAPTLRPRGRAPKDRAQRPGASLGRRVRRRIGRLLRRLRLR
jgi:glycosyltransferase involved in cell wall biosynthesis